LTAGGVCFFNDPALHPTRSISITMITFARLSKEERIYLPRRALARLRLSLPVSSGA
jgi:hypothetical protein